MADLKFLVFEDGNGAFVSMQRAGVLMNSMWSRVNLGQYVLLPDFTVRNMTDQERSQIQRIADEADADK